MVLTAQHLEGLAKAYIELVALFKRGAMAEAHALRDRIAADLNAALAAVWSTARRQIADGDHYGALLSLHTVFNIHRQNLLNIELPISQAACYAEMAGLLQTMGQPVAASAAATLATREHGFYQPTPSCQIAILGALFETLFGQRTDGTFVEIGAFDGETFSNTSCLADLGWRGVYVEPVEGAHRKCVERHRRNPSVSVLNCAIGPEDATIRFWDSAEFSTGSAEVVAAHAAQGHVAANAREIAVPQLRLDRVLAEQGIAPGFDLLVVDVEGMEEQVFRSFDVERWRPRCMIIELHDGSGVRASGDQSIAAAARLRAAIRDRGYEEVYRDQANTVFRRREPGDPLPGRSS